MKREKKIIPNKPATALLIIFPIENWKEVAMIVNAKPLLFCSVYPMFHPIDIFLVLIFVFFFAAAFRLHIATIFIIWGCVSVNFFPLWSEWHVGYFSRVYFIVIRCYANVKSIEMHKRKSNWTESNRTEQQLNPWYYTLHIAAMKSLSEI